MSILGIDVSTKAVDLVTLNDDTDAAEWQRIELAGKTDRLENIRSLRQGWPRPSWFDNNGVWLVGLEDPISRNTGTAKALGIITGAVLALLPHDLCVIQTRPYEWKKEFSGTALAAKAEISWRVHTVAQAASRHLFTWPQDACDAYAIAYAVRAINQRAIDHEEGKAA